MENINFDSLKRRRDLRIILPVFLVSIIACIDRVNISYAKLTMTQTLGWLSPEVYGFGAGIFFAGYLLLEIPGSLFAAKFSASKWIARIMFTWGAVSLCMAFVTTEWQFYLCRFPLRRVRSQPLSGHLFPPIPPLVYGSRTVPGDVTHAYLPAPFNHRRCSHRRRPLRAFLLRPLRLAGTVHPRIDSGPHLCLLLLTGRQGSP